MTEDVQPDGNKLSELIANYLSRLHFVKSENIEEEFNNCSVFRISLYILRERLFTFIKERFEKFRKENSRSSIKQTIKKNVRTTNPSGKQLEYVSRQERIEALNETELTADWRTIARCYTGSFLACKDTKKQFDLNYADPKELLEILKNCSLFSDDLYTAAFAVIGNRNKYYGHLSVLIIDSDTLKTLNSATETLTNHIQA